MNAKRIMKVINALASAVMAIISLFTGKKKGGNNDEVTKGTKE